MEERRDVMEEVLTEEQLEALYTWLTNKGYYGADGLDDWARDSDYYQDDDDTWLDEQGYVVDPVIQAWWAMEAEQSVD
jgi:hypothetical protein